MKKILTLLMVLLAVSLAGGIYHTSAHIDKVGHDTADYTYTEESIPAMPEIMIDTISVVPLY